MTILSQRVWDWEIILKKNAMLLPHRYLCKFPASSRLCFHRPLQNSLHRVALAVLRGGQELLPLKVAPIQPSVTAAFHLAERQRLPNVGIGYDKFGTILLQTHSGTNHQSQLATDIHTICHQWNLTSWHVKFVKFDISSGSPVYIYRYIIYIYMIP